MEQPDSVKVLLTVERIEGKIDRMGDRIKITEERVEALLDVVTGSKTGARSGLVVRVLDLEKRMAQMETAVTQIDSMDDKLGKVLRMQEEHPPLLYLLRFQTRKTVFWIILAFLMLSLWYVSGFRQPILEFLGLPVF